MRITLTKNPDLRSPRDLLRPLCTAPQIVEPRIPSLIARAKYSPLNIAPPPIQPLSNMPLVVSSLNTAHILVFYCPILNHHDSIINSSLLAFSPQSHPTQIPEANFDPKPMHFRPCYTSFRICIYLLLFSHVFDDSLRPDIIAL